MEIQHLAWGFFFVTCLGKVMARVVFYHNEINLGTGSMAAWYVHFTRALALSYRGMCNPSRVCTH